MAEPIADVIVLQPPGEVITELMLRLSAEHGRMVQPRVTLEGTRFPLRGGALRGAAEIVVSAEEGGTRVRIVGEPPPWPFRLGWARRMIRRYLPDGTLHRAG